MKTEINQKISQFMDDELHHSEQEVFLLTINKDSELTDKFNRYKAVSHALRTDEFILPDEGFLQGIKQQLEQEPHYLLPKKKNKNSSGFWPKTAVALAASAGFVAVLVYQEPGFQQNNTQIKNDIVVISEQQVVDVAAAELAKVQLANELADRQHERLKAYIQAHSNDLYTHGSVNIQPYARVANYGRD